MASSLPLTGRVALVTGSSRGIGAAIVHRLVDDGANVIVNYVSNAKAANDVVATLNAKRPGAAVAVQADVSGVAQSQTLVDATLEAFGRLDIVVLNAGIMSNKTLGEIDEGPLFLVKAAAPKLEPGARVIFFSSTITHTSMVPSAALVYAASKGAVEQSTRVLAKELGPRSITVNCIAPVPIDTDMFRVGRTEQQIAFYENLHPEKRLGGPVEVAQVAAFLASSGSRWVNGQTIMVNGGYTV